MSLGSGLRSVVQDVIYGPAPREDSAFGRRVAFGDAGSSVIAAALRHEEPCLVARFGSSELGCASFFTRWRRGRAGTLPYPTSLRAIMRVNAGVFPIDDDGLDAFSRAYLLAATRVDVMGVWFNRNEDHIIGECCPDARLVHLESLNAVIRSNPWSAELADKRVLVVHPFAKTIESQYRDKRELLFANPETLPKFELQTLPAVQSAAGAECGFASWSDALDAMCEQIAEREFDVAIIGAGAYGLPVGAFVKDLGRKAVHMGGATQLLFGIRGKRWEEQSPDDVVPLFNEHWARPSAEETPEHAGSVEGGCYW